MHSDMAHRFTIGVEEEFQIIDPATWELRSHVSELIAAGTPSLGDQIKQEMHQSIVEVGTRVCADVSELRHEMLKIRCELAESYRFLRQVEHRIQMVNDRQTHDLPEQPEEMNRIARFMAYPDAKAFALDFLRHVDIVRANYRAVFELVPDLPDTKAVGPERDFRGDDPEPAPTVAALRAMGYHDTKRIVSAA